MCSLDDPGLFREIMEMRLTQNEALDLLRKWMDENRVIHVALTGDGFMARIPGRIDSIDPEKNVHISLTKSSFRVGQHTLVKFSISNCQFEYSDAKDAPLPLASQLLGYDALLYVYLQTAGIGLCVLPPHEWQNI